MSYLKDKLRAFYLLSNRYLVLLLLLLLPMSSVWAAQQFQGLCSYIRIEIKQELALERIGFLATLEVTNNEGDAVLTNFSAGLTFTKTDAAGNTIDVSDKFFVKPPELSGIASIDGTGLIEPGETAIISWFIIPKITAGGESPVGIDYDVGAELAGALYGNEIDPTVLLVIPDTITVRPEPQLDITYFQPRDVDGDNPFTTDIVETPIPFTLGVLVKNSGFGQANKVVIKSEQPKIVENIEDLLIVPKLIGARINDEPVNNASLTVNLGDIDSGSCRKGAWDMITTLSGEFTEFNASYTHSSELGGEETSVINSINAYFFVHEVLNDQTGRDSLLDFLATTDKTQQDLIPDALYETDCNVLPVNRLNNASITSYNGLTATVHATADFENWVFIRLDDPAQNKFPIVSIVRSDGKILNPNNYWTNLRYEKNTNNELTYLNIFDNVALGEYDYEVTYKVVDIDITPPATTLLFSGAFEQGSGTEAGTTYVLPDTQLFFIVDDASPVGTFYRTNPADLFQPAYPFKLGAGSYTLEYYSEDSFTNRETTQTANIVVTDSYPAINNIQSNVDEILIAGDSVSVRPTTVDLDFSGTTVAATLEGKVEIYRGVYAWPTLSGIPSTPTNRDTAMLTVGGLNVDFYRYKSGTGNWSIEYPVSQPITLTGLTGNVVLTVQARSQYGTYSTDALDYLEATWTVSASAPPINATTPTTPSSSVNAQIQVSDVDLYRWLIDDSYFRAEAATSTPVILENLTEAFHVLKVIGKVGSGAFQDQANASEVSWQVDRDYGYRLPVSKKVYEKSLGVLTNSTQFSWNGRNQNGAPVEPGWYSIKVIVVDGLGRSSSSIKLVEVGNLIPGSKILPVADTAPHKEVHGKGNWAVWQDQRNGSWNIFSRNLFDPVAAETAITTGLLNQERPRTDGEYVVWQSRQADGNWDVQAKRLNSSDAVILVTQSSDKDEIRPVIEWPWVIYQSKPVNNPGAPWQLMVKNLLTGNEQALDTTTQDQLDPEIDQQRVVWQDFRDVGAGEIYFKDLVSGDVRRITDDPGGQYHPVIENQWIVWEDNTALQFDLYGFNLNRGVSLQLTNTPEDETRPRLNEHWVVYEEDLAGEQKINLRLLSLYNQASIQLTNAASNKEKPSMLSGKLVWTDQPNGYPQVLVTDMPDLQPVFDNKNIVAITPGILGYITQAADLLKLWQAEAGVVEITRFSQLLPVLVSETLTWDGSAVIGTDFTLAEGDFLWVKFSNTHILDFASSDCAGANLNTGTNVLSSGCFPDDYSAYQLLKDIGLANVSALRILNSNTGRWSVATVVNGKIVGENFRIPNVTVVLVEMTQDVTNWRPSP